MNIRNFIAVFGTALLFVGCSSDNSVSSGSKSLVKSLKVFSDSSTIASSKTRTTTSGTSVVWASGDGLSIFDRTSASVNKHYILDDGVGSTAGYFNANTAEDGLTNGTYVLTYPYSQTKYTAENPLDLTATIQSGTSNSQLAQYDWLVSNEFTVQDGVVSDIYLHHVFSLVQFNIKLKAIGTKVTKLSQIVLQTNDDSPAFYGRVYFDGSSNIAFAGETSSTAVSLPNITMSTSNISAWLVTKQFSLATQPLQVKVYFYSGNTITSAIATVAQSKILEVGKRYTMDLELELNNTNINSSTLTITSKS